MPSVSQLDSPPSSPKSPPRKRTKFSLKLKSKKKAASESSDKREKLFPIFSSPAAQNASDDDNLEPPKPPLPYAGLRNHGNICYANAVLQVLRHCPGLLDCVDKIDSHVKAICPSEIKSHATESDNKDTDDLLRRTCILIEDKLPDTEDLEASSGEDHKSVVCGLNELFSQMKDLEQHYSENKENCEHLLQRRNTLVLAAKPLDFMQTFRSQNPLFEDNLQHDAQEFLCSLLVNLQDTDKEIKKKMAGEGSKRNGSKHMENVPAAKSSTGDSSQDFSSLEDLFHGRLLHQTKCMTCEDAKKRFENFQDISVPVQKEPKVYDPKAFSPTPKKGQDTQTLSWALSQFARIEHLSGDNKYFCDNCLTHTEAEISTSFDKLPRILTIHLKRFTANTLSGFSGFVSKITSNLETPMELSITEWCSKTCAIPNPTYQLFGIVMHSGMTSCSGHYQAYIKVATPTFIDLNNNGQAIHHDDQCVNNGKVDTDIESSNECDTRPSSNTLNGTAVGCNTYARDGKSSETMEMTSSVEESDVLSPQSSAEKVKTTCISGIARYFNKSRKHSTKETKENQDERSNGDFSGDGKKRRHHSTPTYSFTGNNRSVNKIQSFLYHSGASNRSAIRQLNFQDNLRQQRECQNSTHDEEMSRAFADVPHTQTFQWIHFDDAEVATLEESDVAALLSSSESSFTSPYLLFYKLAGP